MYILILPLRYFVARAGLLLQASQAAVTCLLLSTELHRN